MFGSFRRSLPARGSLPSLRSSLVLEQLEDRMCPAAPVVTNLFAQHIGMSLIVSGQISDESPTQASVALGGALSATVTPDSGGMFTYMTTYTSGSQVTAQATDIEALTSSQFSTNIRQPNPNVAITTSVTYGSAKQITITGHVTDANVAGRLVTFSGAASGSTTCNANGDYSITLTANSLGTVTAQAYDAVGQYSATANATLSSSAPVISNFNVSESSDHWFHFTGTVTDESPGGLTIYFGGAPISLMGKMTTVAADGSFSFWIQLNGTQSDEGTATALVTDWWGLNSTLATCLVHQTGV